RSLRRGAGVPLVRSFAEGRLLEAPAIVFPFFQGNRRVFRFVELDGPDTGAAKVAGVREEVLGAEVVDVFEYGIQLRALDGRRHSGLARRGDVDERVGRSADALLADVQLPFFVGALFEHDHLGRRLQAELLQVGTDVGLLALFFPGVDNAADELVYRVA